LNADLRNEELEMVFGILSLLTAQGMKDKTRRTGTEDVDSVAEEERSSVGRYAFPSSLFIPKDHAVFVYSQEFGKYKAVQPYHCSTQRSQFTTARRDLAFPTKNGKCETPKRELAI